LSPRCLFALSVLFAIALGGCEKAAEGDGAKRGTGGGSDPTIGATRATPQPCVGADCLPQIDLKDVMNQTYPAASLRGKVVVINFWATWCKPCKKEIPAFSRVFDRYKDQGVAMFGIAQEDIATVDLLNFASDFEMSYPILLVDDLLARNFGLAGNIPTTYIYDKTGKKVVSRVGGLEESELEFELQRLLAQ